MLREAKMMGVCGPATADQTRLCGHEPDVLLVTKERGSGWASRLLSIPSAMAGAGSPGCRSSDEDDGWSTDTTSDTGCSLMSAALIPAALSSAASLARKASSTCHASAAVKLFLAPRIRWAQMAASSDEGFALSSPTSFSRNMADASAPRIGFAGFETTFAPRRPANCWGEWPWPLFSRSCLFGAGFAATGGIGP